MAEPCGCEVGYTGSRMTLRQVVVWCPLHAAAKVMLAALEEIRDSLDAALQDDDLDLEALTDTELPAYADLARKAVAAAGGSVHADLSGLGDDDCRQYVEEVE